MLVRQCQGAISVFWKLSATGPRCMSQQCLCCTTEGTLHDWTQEAKTWKLSVGAEVISISEIMGPFNPNDIWSFICLQKSHKSDRHHLGVSIVCFGRLMQTNSWVHSRNFHASVYVFHSPQGLHWKGISLLDVKSLSPMLVRGTSHKFQGKGLETASKTFSRGIYPFCS